MTVSLLRGDALHLPLADATADLVVTSPPYFGLRSYQDGGEHYPGQIGSEATPAEWLDAMLAATAEMVRVLKPCGSIWVNLGDKYSQRVAMRPSSHQDGLFPNRPELVKDWKRDRALGLARMPYENITDRTTGQYVPEKSLIGLPWRYAIACIDQLGLILRAEVIWAKPNGLPESVTDRVRRSHETWFHLVKQPRYFAAVDEIREPHHDKAGPPSRYGVVREANMRTDGLSKPRGSIAAGAARDYNPLGKLPGSVWSIPSQPLTVPPELGVDHFAAFPMEWPRRLIAGWSPSGVCVVCAFLLGSSYDSGMLGVRKELRRPRQERQEGRFLLEGMRESAHFAESEVDQIPTLDDTRLCRGLESDSPNGAEVWLHDGAPADHGRALGAPARSERSRASSEQHQGGQPDRESGAARQDRARPTPEASTQTFRMPSLRRHDPDLRHAQSCPNCGCDSFQRPVVADVFGGTGTTALVAHVMGRHGISVDMSADYTRLARWRTTDPDQLAAAAQVDKPPRQVTGQDRLFDFEGAS